MAFPNVNAKKSSRKGASTEELSALRKEILNTIDLLGPATKRAEQRQAEKKLQEEQERAEERDRQLALQKEAAERQLRKQMEAEERAVAKAVRKQKKAERSLELALATVDRARQDAAKVADDLKSLDGFSVSTKSSRFSLMKIRSKMTRFKGSSSMLHNKKLQQREPTNTLITTGGLDDIREDPVLEEVKALRHTVNKLEKTSRSVPYDPLWWLRCCGVLRDTDDWTRSTYDTRTTDYTSVYII